MQSRRWTTNSMYGVGLGHCKEQNNPQPQQRNPIIFPPQKRKDDKALRQCKVPMAEVYLVLLPLSVTGQWVSFSPSTFLLLCPVPLQPKWRLDVTTLLWDWWRAGDTSTGCPSSTGFWSAASYWKSSGTPWKTSALWNEAVWMVVVRREWRVSMSFGWACEWPGLSTQYKYYISPFNMHQKIKNPLCLNLFGHCPCVTFVYVWFFAGFIWCVGYKNCNKRNCNKRNCNKRQLNQAPTFTQSLVYSVCTLETLSGRNVETSRNVHFEDRGR